MPDEIIIEHFSVQDAEEFAKMEGQSWRDTYPNEAHGVSLEYIQKVTARRETEKKLEERRARICQSHNDPHYFLRVARRNGKIVGFIDGLKGEKNELVGLYVDKAEYGTGLARKLWRSYLEWIGPGKAIVLTVASYNDRAKAFYRKIGFAEMPETHRRYEDSPMFIVDMIRKGEEL